MALVGATYLAFQQLLLPLRSYNLTACTPRRPLSDMLGE